MSSPDSTDTLNPTPAAEPGAAKDVPAQDLLATARQEAAQNYDRYLRAMADLENFRRRSVREKDELRQFATARVLEDLLPVVDNLVLGLSAAKQEGADLTALAGGMELTLSQLKAVLASHGLKEIHPLGQPFDANFHEAISAQPSATVPEGSVVTVVRTGYALSGRLLRPAAVIVSGGPGAKDEAKA
jgi:molecular chaperone GrpE